MTEEKKTFSKASILEKQKGQQEEYEKKMGEMRKALEEVASTTGGERVLKYLFLLSGGDMGSVRRDKEGVIDTDDTLLTLGAKSVWESLRYAMTSETIMRIERHNWEV